MPMDAVNSEQDRKIKEHVRKGLKMFQHSHHLVCEYVRNFQQIEKARIDPILLTPINSKWFETRIDLPIKRINCKSSFIYNYINIFLNYGYWMSSLLLKTNPICKKLRHNEEY